MKELITQRPNDLQFTRFVRCLPRDSPLLQKDLLRDETLMYRDRHLSIYYARFDYVNKQARIAIVGITPGWRQVEIAYRKCRDELLGGSNSEGCAAAVRC